jgi:hypothetical protein
MASLFETTGGGTIYTDLQSAGKTIIISNPLLPSGPANRTLLWETRDFGIPPQGRLAGTERPLEGVDYLIVPGRATFIAPLKVINLGTTMAEIKLVIVRESASGAPGDAYWIEPGFPVGAGEAAHLSIQGFSMTKASGVLGGVGDALYAEVQEGSQLQVYGVLSETIVFEHQRNTRADS